MKSMGIGGTLQGDGNFIMILNGGKRRMKWIKGSAQNMLKEGMQEQLLQPVLPWL